MDELIGLAFLILYFVVEFLTRRRKKAKRQQQQQQPRPQPARPEAASPSSGLEDALREIREALGGRSEPAPRPLPPAEKPKLQPAPKPAPLPPSRLSVPAKKPARPTEFKRANTRYSEEAFETLPAETRYSEEAFESLPAFRGEAPFPQLPARQGPSQPQKAKPSPAAAALQAQPVSSFPATRTSAMPHVENLREAAAAREAIILAEILGPPRALKPLRPPFMHR